jgi:hypothetical protein
MTLEIFCVMPILQFSDGGQTTGHFVDESVS